MYSLASYFIDDVIFDIGIYYHVQSGRTQISKMTVYMLNVWSIISGRDRDLSPQHHPPILYPTDTGGSFPRCKNDHSPLLVVR
jgi:hypothetical protein